MTHNVLRFTLENSGQVDFIPGQATLIAVDKDGWRDKKHPFTFTSTPDDERLEFTIKIYPDHEGVTNELSKVSVGDYLILDNVFGAINYKGKGTFIAGGAGVTPFISIIRTLSENEKLDGNKLVFANSQEKDIIDKEAFDSLLGDNFFNILSQENNEKYAHGYIDANYLTDKINSNEEYIYLCGPQPMMTSVEKSLEKLGVTKDRIIKEKFD